LGVIPTEKGLNDKWEDAALRIRLHR